MPAPPAVTPGNGTKLLYIVNDPAFFVSHRLDLALAAVAAGYRVAVAGPGAPDDSTIGATPIRAIDLPMARGRASIRAELASVGAARRILRDGGYEIVHVVTLKASLIAGLAARWAGARNVIFAITGLGLLFTGTGARAATLRSAVVPLLRFAFAGRGRRHTIFQNRGDRALMERLGITPPGTTVLIRGSGVDVTRFVPAPEPHGPVTILFPARLLAQKGLHDFVAAARMVKPRRPDARFVLAGKLDPESPSGVAEIVVRGWEGEGIVAWLGHSDDMTATLAASHIVCLPTFYGEGVPRALIEAAAVARPIVASDIAGCREIVAPGVNGLLVPPRDPAALADALVALIDDPARRRAFGAAGRALVEREMSLPQVIAETLALYTETLGR